MSYAVRGVLLDVFNKPGPMLPERFDQEAIAFGLAGQGIDGKPEQACEVYYRGVRVGLDYVDLWIEGGQIILALG